MHIIYMLAGSMCAIPVFHCLRDSLSSSSLRKLASITPNAWNSFRKEQYNVRWEVAKTTPSQLGETPHPAKSQGKHHTQPRRRKNYTELQIQHFDYTKLGNFVRRGFDRAVLHQEGRSISPSTLSGYKAKRSRRGTPHPRGGSTMV